MIFRSPPGIILITLPAWAMAGSAHVAASASIVGSANFTNVERLIGILQGLGGMRV